MKMYYFCVSTRFYSVDAWVNSYTETIYLVRNEDDWVVPNKIKQIKILKPPFCTKVDQPKTNRMPSKGEKKKALHHCSSCDGQCHNRSTCKYIMLAPSTISGSDTRRTD